MATKPPADTPPTSPASPTPTPTPRSPRSMVVGRRRWGLGALAAAAAATLAWLGFRNAGRGGGSPSGGAALTTLEAVLERLLPAEAGMPSASEAKVAVHVEAELAKPHFASSARAIKLALTRFDEAAVARGAKSFAALGTQAQNDILVAFAAGTLTRGARGEAAVFQMMLSLALEGYFGAPAHGGNAGAVAWHAIGFDTACQAAHPVPVSLP